MNFPQQIQKAPHYASQCTQGNFKGGRWRKMKSVLPISCQEKEHSYRAENGAEFCRPMVSFLGTKQ